MTLPPRKRYTPYQPGPFKMKMNLQTLDLADWIEPDEQLPTMLAEKARLLNQRHAEVFAAQPQAMAGAQETLTLLVEHLTRQFPQLYHQHDDWLHNRATAERWNLTNHDLHPLDLAGRLVQEDLCLMGHNPETDLYHLTAASLCFPSRWRLAEKLGRTLGGVHNPVPHYKAKLDTPMNRLFARLKTKRPVWRLNWGLTDDPALFQPIARPPAEPITAANAGHRLWLRVERQTLRRLPHSGDILFTIRIHMHCLAEIITTPKEATRFAAAIRGLDPAMQTYKSITPHHAPLLNWLTQMESTG